MVDLTPIYDLIPRLLPFPGLEARFLQQALVALLLLAPMTAAMGVQVVNFRMAFFADAISHSAFAGVAAGLLLAIDPHWTVPALGLLVGLGIVAVQRRSGLSSDTVIGVFFSAMIAFGLAVVSRDKTLARDLQRFLYGDILTITEPEILRLAGLFIILMFFQGLGYNRMLAIGVSPSLAGAHRVKVAFYQYSYAALLAVVVAFSVRAVGVLLVTAMLIVPAAAARNLTRTAGGMFWWALVVNTTSAVAGLIVSAQDWARTATGSTVVLFACAWFAASLAAALFARKRS